MTKLEAVNELVLHDHGFLNPKGAWYIIKPFGFNKDNFELQKQQDTRSEFKGLYLQGINPKTGEEYKEGEWAEGYDAADLAVELCCKLKIKYRDMFGRGSLLRSACEALQDSLKK